MNPSYITPRMLFLFCASFCLPLASLAQQPSTAPGTSRVELYVSVTGKNDKPVLGLTQQDFTFTDNGQPVPIVAFRAATPPPSDPPTQIIIVLDQYNGNLSEVARERDELKHFLTRNGGQLAFPTTVVIFNQTGFTPTTHPVTNGNALAHFIDLLPVAPRPPVEPKPTDAADHFKLSIETLRAMTTLPAAKLPGHKLLIWIGRGWPNLAGGESGRGGRGGGRGAGAPGKDAAAGPDPGTVLFNSIVDTTNLLRQANITLENANSIALGKPITDYFYEPLLKPTTSPADAQFGALIVQVLAAHTGGQVLNEVPDLSDEIPVCLADATSYVVTIEAPKSPLPNQYHPITVRVDKPNTTARTLAGYYSQP